MVKTSNGALSSLRRESAPGTSRVRENTSNGPAKSSTSTSSKIKMPTVCFFVTAPSSLSQLLRRCHNSFVVVTIASSLSQFLRHQHEMRRLGELRILKRHGATVCIAKGSIEAWQLRPEIDDLDVDRPASGSAAVLLRGRHHPSSDSASVQARLHRQHTDVAALAARLDVDARVGAAAVAVGN